MLAQFSAILSSPSYLPIVHNFACLPAQTPLAFFYTNEEHPPHKHTSSVSRFELQRRHLFRRKTVPPVSFEPTLYWEANAKIVRMINRS